LEGSLHVELFACTDLSLLLRVQASIAIAPNAEQLHLWAYGLDEQDAGMENFDNFFNRYECSPIHARLFLR